jgi:hypothetical protein
MARRTWMITLMLLGPELAEAEQPLRVTTDNHAYCQVLLERISAAPGAAYASAAQLAQEGRQLCSNGHPRTGIAKLRRALRVALAQTH